MPRSLAGRLLFASVLLLPILLGVSAYMLDLAFRRSLLSGENERLRAQAYLLLGAAEIIEGQLWMPEQFEEPRLNQIDSGLYGLITNGRGDILWRSPSARLLRARLPRSPLLPGDTSFGILPTSQGSLFAYTHDVVWETEAGEQPLRVTVLHQQDTVEAEQSAYRHQLWRWLGLLAVLIVLTQALVLKWGLRPLRGLARDLQLIESGAEAQLRGDYPKEIQAVTDNLNQVLDSQRQQRERYRHTMQDLAHSLKTPLSVIQGSLGSGDGEVAATIGEQVERMRQIVDHQLKRAVVSSGGFPGKSVSVAAVAQRLLQSLAKVYRDKDVQVVNAVDPACAFPGDEGDLLELLGNVLDNAYKYCRRQLIVSAQQNESELRVRIEDDGPGIAPEQRNVVLQRGARADTATAGHGIGLAVAVDIISGYRGSLQVEESTLGGAAFVISLPCGKPR